MSDNIKDYSDHNDANSHQHHDRAAQTPGQGQGGENKGGQGKGQGTQKQGGQGQGNQNQDTR